MHLGYVWEASGSLRENHCMPITLHCVLSQHHQNPYNQELICESIILCYNATTYNHNILGLLIPFLHCCIGLLTKLRCPLSCCISMSFSFACWGECPHFNGHMHRYELSALHVLPSILQFMVWLCA